MKRIIVKTVLALTFSMLLSSPTYAEWSRIGKNVSEDTFYVDFDSIREDKDFVYFWGLVDLRKNIYLRKGSIMSSASFHQLDCKFDRLKKLSVMVYTEPMGSNYLMDLGKDDEWIYFPPQSVYKEIANRICGAVR